ncbi:MAG: hypothetical protein ABH846_03985 [Patescibacteria group bacterium]
MIDQKFLPALADLNQDIAGPIPVEIIQKWIESDQTDQDHEQILEPYKKFGTMVSSDSAGLSKLSAKRSLIEVMKLVNDPKEIIYSHGRAIGGQAIGIWAADNTQMFYDDSVDVNDVVKQMIGAQKKIHEQCEVRVGIGIHTGSAFEIGGGLYGAEADKIEDFTEEETSGEEIAISKAVAEKIDSELKKEIIDRGEMISLAYSNLEIDAQTSDDVFYPAPFHRQFHDELRATSIDDTEGLEIINNKFTTSATIILIRVFLPGNPRLLDDLTQRVAANSIIYDIEHKYNVKIIKSNGMLGILECDDENEAVDFSMALFEEMKKDGFDVNIGLCKGDVLIFDLDQGGRDLAGSPANIASKLAEDTDERNAIFLEASVADHARQHGKQEKFTVEKSGVKIEGIRIT